MKVVFLSHPIPGLTVSGPHKFANFWLMGWGLPLCGAHTKNCFINQIHFVRHFNTRYSRFVKQSGRTDVWYMPSLTSPLRAAISPAQSGPDVWEPGCPEKRFMIWDMPARRNRADNIGSVNGMCIVHGKCMARVWEVYGTCMESVWDV